MLCTSNTRIWRQFLKFTYFERTERYPKQEIVYSILEEANAISCYTRLLIIIVVFKYIRLQLETVSEYFIAKFYFLFSRINSRNHFNFAVTMHVPTLCENCR